MLSLFLNAFSVPFKRHIPIAKIIKDEIIWIFAPVF